MNFGKYLTDAGFAVYYIFLITGAVFLLFTEKGDILLWINESHNEILDIFFKYWTHLGDGLVFAILMVTFLAVNYFRALVLAMAVVSQTLVVQGLKRFVFSDVIRPQLFFDHFGNLHRVPGVEILTYNSFPSGHTATAFTVAILLSLISRNKYLTGLLMIMAILVGISRVYLLQHFFVDIYFGSVIGFLNGMIVFIGLNSSSLSDKPALNKGLIIK